MTIRPAENEYEKALMLQVLKFNDVFGAVYEETAPHKVAPIFMNWRMSSKILS